MQVKTNSIQIEYETFGKKSSPAILLIAGLGTQLTYWQEEFCFLPIFAGFFLNFS